MAVMCCRAGNGEAPMLTSEGHLQLEELLKQVLVLRDLLQYEPIPASSSSSSSSRNPISRALGMFTGRREQERHQNQRHHDNHRQQQQQEE